MLFLLVHFLILTSLAGYFFRRSKGLSFETKVYAAFILTWSSIVCTSAFLACFNQFDNDLLFAVLVAILQGIGANFISRGYRDLPAVPDANPSVWLKDTFSSVPRAFLGIAFVGITFVLFIMCVFGIMQIPDTLSMKLPNAFFYLQGGNLLPHRDMSDNGRLFSTPINGTLWWSYFLVRWQTHGKIVLFLNLFNWAIAISAIYRFSRILKISRWGSFLTCMFFAFSLGELFQAASDNDDLLSSVSAIVGAVFVLRWLSSRLAIDLLVASAGVGLSVGSKYFPVLYAPAFLLLGAYVAYSIYKGKLSLGDLKIRQFVCAGILSAVLVVPYLAARFIDEKNIGPAALLSMSENKPFRADIAGHNILVYNSQLFLSPLVDAFAPLHGSHRERVVSAFNDFMVKNIVPVVEGVFAYMPGVIIVHQKLYDNTAWYGLVSFLFLFCIFWALFKKENRFSIWFWLAVFFISWDLFFCARTKYIEELGRYWHLPIALVLPLVGKISDQYFADTSESAGRRFFKFVLYGILAVTVFSGYYGLLYNPIRYNFFQAWNREIQKHEVSPAMKAILRECDKVNVRNVIYGFPIYSIMHDFRGKHFLHNFNSKEGELEVTPALKVALDFRFYQFKFIPIELPTITGGGFKNSGDSGYGVPLFVKQNQGARCPAARTLEGPEFALAQVQIVADNKDKSFSVEVQVDGTDKLPESSFRTVFSEPSGSRAPLNEWTREKKFVVPVPDRTGSLEVEISSNDKIYSGSIQIKAETK